MDAFFEVWLLSVLASRILLSILVYIFCSSGPLIAGLDDSIERLRVPAKPLRLFVQPQNASF